MVVSGLLWIPLISRMSDTLYEYLQSVQAYIAPPIAAVFFLGVFVKRINAYGCMAGLVSGFILGMGRLIAELNKGVLEGGPLHYYAHLNFLYFCVVLFAVSVITIVVVSLLTPKPKDEQIKGLTYATMTDKDKEEVRASWNKWDVINTVAVFALIITIYCYFNG